MLQGSMRYSQRVYATEAQEGSMTPAGVEPKPVPKKTSSDGSVCGILDRRHARPEADNYLAETQVAKLVRTGGETPDSPAAMSLRTLVDLQ
jgi:hypothetical protein